MARLFTSDLHLGHENIRAYTGRPYASVDDMDADLMARWNDTVAPDDEVWVLGDLAMGRIAQTLPVATLLNGKKVLVPGNHDRCWDGLRSTKKDRVDEWRERYAEVGFEIVDGPHTIELVGRQVLVDHFPYVGDSTGEERHLSHRPKDLGLWELHGHVHTEWRQRGRMINVGVDAWGGRPVSETVLAGLVDAGERDLEPLAWTRSIRNPL